MLFFFINSNWYCGDVTKLFSFSLKTKQNLKNPAFTNNASTVFGGTRKALVLTLKVPKSYMVGGLEGGEKMQ